MNSIMEQWIKSRRTELLDHALIYNRAHLLDPRRTTLEPDRCPHRAAQPGLSRRGVLPRPPPPGAAPATGRRQDLHTAQETLIARGEDHSRRATNGSDYLLAGLITCTRCGARFVGGAPNGNKYRHRCYTCFTRHRYGVSECDAERLPAEELDQTMLDRLLDTYSATTSCTVPSPENANEPPNTIKALRVELAVTEADLAKAEEAIECYLLAFDNGTMPETTCSQRVQALADKLAGLRERRRPPRRTRHHRRRDNANRPGRPAPPHPQVPHQRKGQKGQHPAKIQDPHARRPAPAPGEGSEAAWVGAPGRTRTCDQVLRSDQGLNPVLLSVLSGRAESEIGIITWLLKDHGLAANACETTLKGPGTLGRHSRCGRRRTPVPPQRRRGAGGYR